MCLNQSSWVFCTYRSDMRSCFFSGRCFLWMNRRITFRFIWILVVFSLTLTLSLVSFFWRLKVYLLARVDERVHKAVEYSIINFHLVCISVSYNFNVLFNCFVSRNLQICYERHCSGVNYPNMLLEYFSFAPCVVSHISSCTRDFALVLQCFLISLYLKWFSHSINYAYTDKISNGHISMLCCIHECYVQYINKQTYSL